MECIQKTCILPIKFQNEVTTYNDYGLPLCIILAYKDLQGWYFEHFVNIYSEFHHLHSEQHKDLDTSFTRLLYVDGWEAFNNVLNIETIDMNTYNVNLQFLITQLNKGNYIIINLDEYYLKDKYQYTKKHYIHRSLIYGCDLINNTFYAIGFNSNSIFSEIKIGFEEFCEAIRLVETNGTEWEKTICLLRPKPEYKLHEHNNLENFLIQLKNYIYSIRVNTFSTSKYTDFEIIDKMENVLSFGYDTHKTLVNNLEKLKSGDKASDRIFHDLNLMKQHKKGILDRIDHFLPNKFPLNDVLKKLRNDYHLEVSQKFSLVMSIWIKEKITNEHLDEDFYSYISNNETISKIIEIITQASTRELYILQEILKEAKSVE